MKTILERERTFAFFRLFDSDDCLVFVLMFGFIFVCCKGCIFYSVCGALFGFVSISTMTLISIERYIVIKNPFKNLESNKPTAIGMRLFSILQISRNFNFWFNYLKHL
jgi:hypothetical protein